MLTDDEILLAIDDVPITSRYVLDVGRAIERAALAKAQKTGPTTVRRAFEQWMQLGIVQQTVAKVGRHFAWCIWNDAWNASRAGGVPMDPQRLRELEAGK